MTNRSDLFDEPEEPRSQPPPSQETHETPAGDASETAALPRTSGEGGIGGFSRRNFLRGAGAAAVAGAVVGAGAAVGLGATDGNDGGNAPEREGMTLGAPPNKAVDEAVIKLTVNGEDHWLGVYAHETLAEVLRRKLALTGTKIGCDRSE